MIAECPLSEYGITETEVCRMAKYVGEHKTYDPMKCDSWYHLDGYSFRDDWEGTYLSKLVITYTTVYKGVRYRGLVGTVSPRRAAFTNTHHQGIDLTTALKVLQAQIRATE